MTRMRKVLLIVEGHGEERSMPGLVARFFRHVGHDDFVPHQTVLNSKTCSRIIAAHKPKSGVGVEHYVAIALRHRPDAILILVDSDDECIRRARMGRRPLGPELLERARQIAPHLPIRVVVANREFEAWFIAAWPHIASGMGSPPGVALPDKIRRGAEVFRGFDKRLSELLGYRYIKTTHQPKLCRHLPFEGETLAFAPSYGRLLSALNTLVEDVRRGST